MDIDTDTLTGIQRRAKAAGAHAMITLDAEKHVWCPTCKATPGEPCRVTKAELRLDPNAGLHVDHDGETCVHMSRIMRADNLADGAGGWNRHELYAVVHGLEFHREGRAS